MGRTFTFFFLMAGALGCVGDSTATTPDSGLDSGSGPDVTADVASGCEAGATSCNGQCVVVASDPTNCGRCAHDCGPGGATCKSGVCQPVEITSNAAGAVPLATEASPDNPTTIATHVFWGVPSGTSAGVYQDNVTGGNQITLSTAGVGLSDVAVFGANVYWPGWSGVLSKLIIYQGNVGVAMTSTSVGGLSITSDPGTAFVLDPAGDLFGTYTSSTTCGIYKCPLGKSPCTSITSSSCLPALNIATDGTSIFFADQNGGIIQTTNLAGSSVSTIVTGQATPNLLRVDGTHLYWSNSGTKTLWRSGLGGVNPQQIASMTAAASGLAADSVNVYWTDSTAGTVSYAPIGGGGTTTPYVTQGASSSQMRIVRDTKSLYWIHNTSIWRVALP